MLLRHRICREAPIISHLLFVDDTIIFSKVDDEQAEMVKNILDTYEATSGQQINFDKTHVMFSKVTTRALKIRS